MGGDYTIMVTNTLMHVCAFKHAYRKDKVNVLFLCILKDNVLYTNVLYTNVIYSAICYFNTKLSCYFDTIWHIIIIIILTHSCVEMM